MLIGQPQVLSGPSDVVALRAAMQVLAQRLPSADPGPAPQGVYGGVNDQMISALGYLAGRINMPQELRVALALAPVVASMSTTVRASIVSIISKLASTLTAAVKAYTALGGGTGSGASGGVKYPSGSIQANIKGQWHVAIPIGSQLLGESAFMIEGVDFGAPHGHHGHGGGWRHGGHGRWQGGGGGYYPIPYALPVCQCPTVHMPVIGSDGRTYQNACFAACAGAASVVTPGVPGGLNDMSDFTCETCAAPMLGAAATHEEAGVHAAPVTGPPVVTEQKYKAAIGGPFYTKGWFWGAVAAVAVLSTGTYLALRRPRKARR